METEDKIKINPAQEHVLKRAYKSFDRNGDGVITYEDFEIFYREIELKHYPQRWKKEFKRYDTNEDEKWDFEEFKVWFHEYLTGEVLEPKIWKGMEKLVTKNKVVVNELSNPEMETSTVRVKVGQTENPHSKVEAKIYLNHVDADKHVQHITKGLTVVEGEALGVVRIQTKSGAEVVEKLKILTEEVKASLKQQSLGKEAEMLFDSFKFEYYFDENTVSIGVTTNHALINFLKYCFEYTLAAHGKNLSAFLQCEILHQSDFAELAEKAKDKKFSFRQFLSKNFELLFKFSTTAPSIIPEIMKKSKIGKEMDRMRGASFAFFSIMLSLLQKGTDVTQTYKELKTLEILDFISPTVPKKIIEKDGIKEKVAKKVTELSSGEKEKFAFLKNIADVLKSDLIANFSVSVISPHLAATVHGKTSGLKSFLEYFKKLSDNQGEDDGDEEDDNDQENSDDSD
jgi:hypothetical protein